MYSVAVKRDFVAQHFLIGGDWGAENDWHSHHYQVEVQLQGPTLDQHGYLVDIVDINTHLEALVAAKTLSEVIELQTSFLRKRVEMSVEQAKDFQAIASKAAEKVTAPMKTVFEKAVKELKVA